MERHSFDTASFVTGLLFVVLGVLFLADQADTLDLEARWVWPALLIGLGLAGLLSGRRGEDPDDHEARLGHGRVPHGEPAGDDPGEQ